MAEKLLESENLNKAKDIKVTVSMDGMEAYVNLPLSFDDEGQAYIYSKEEVLEALRRKNVTTGINQEIIKDVVQGRVYNRDILCATGTAPIDGVDGKFEFFFDMNLDRKPKIREDGTADYWTIHLIEIVKKRQIVAIYNEPVQGTNGVDVKGKPVKARVGRSLAPIAGRGFERIEGGRIYVSSTDGKIDYVNNRITILPVYEIYGDVDIKTGNVDFKGDVLVHGNVRKGMDIKATGTVTVDGVIEASDVFAAKDILIRGGVQGGYKANIITKGNLTSGYLEYATVSSEGNLFADSILNCDATSFAKVIVAGKRASIIGGKVYGAGGVEVFNLGSKNIVKTEIYAGKRLEMLKEVFSLQSQIYENEKILKEMTSRLEELTLSRDPGRVDVLRKKVSLQAEVTRDKTRLEYLTDIIDRSQGATVRVMSELNPGVEVAIDTVRTVISNRQNNVEFIVTDKKIRMYSMEYDDRSN